MACTVDFLPKRRGIVSSVVAERLGSNLLVKMHFAAKHTHRRLPIQVLDLLLEQSKFALIVPVGDQLPDDECQDAGDQRSDHNRGGGLLNVQLALAFALPNGVHSQLTALVLRVSVGERTRAVAEKLAGLKLIRITGIRRGRSVAQRFQILDKVGSEITVLQLIDLVGDLPFDDLVERLTEAVDAVRTLLAVLATEPSLIVLEALAPAAHTVALVVAQFAVERV